MVISLVDMLGKKRRIERFRVVGGKAGKNVESNKSNIRFRAAMINQRVRLFS